MVKLRHGERADRLRSTQKLTQPVARRIPGGHTLVSHATSTPCVRPSVPCRFGIPASCAGIFTPGKYLGSDEGWPMNDLVDTTEMYLRTISTSRRGRGAMRAGIAERLEQSGPTVSQTVSRMERDGLVRVMG